MYQLKNENAKNIIEALIPKEILDLNPVIAGGLIVSLYYYAMRYSTPLYDEDLKIKLEQAINGWDSINLTQTLGLDKKFSDIDLWFLKDNLIWEDGAWGHELLSNREEMDVEEKKKIVNSKFSLPELNFDVLKIKQSTLEYFHLTSASRDSYWANTFQVRNSSLSMVQFVKKSFDSIESLFDNFDLINCCAAYHDGIFYFHDDFINYHNQHLLVPGNGFKKKTFLSKIWTMSRCFKYYERYQLNFASDLCEDCVSLMLDMNEVTKQLSENKTKQGNTLGGPSSVFSATAFPGDTIINLQEILAEDNPYGYNDKVSLSKLEGMMSSLYRKFTLLIKMKTFNQDQIFLFLGFKDPGIIVAVEKYIENHNLKIKEISNV